VLLMGLFCFAPWQPGRAKEDIAQEDLSPNRSIVKAQRSGGRMGQGLRENLIMSPLSYSDMTPGPPRGLGFWTGRWTSQTGAGSERALSRPR
jgi:hypothetical protein